MHEMALCEAIVQALEEQATVHAYTRVKRVRLAVGPLSCVEPEALRFSFDACTRGTLADGAVLDIIDTEGTAWCFGCCKTFPVTGHGQECPACGGHQVQVMTGDEFTIKDMEVA